MRFKSLILNSSAALLLSGSAFAYSAVEGPGAQNPGLVSASATADSKASAKAHDFIENLADKGIGFLSDSKLSPEARKQEFRKLLQDNFDMKTIARFSLGRYWKSCTDAQRAEYLKLFEAMIIDVYSRRFSDYNGQKLLVRGARADEGKLDIIVDSAIIPADGPEIKVDWRVRDKNGTLKVVDIIVEGVSMSLTQRADFASVIQRGGGNVDVLLAHLRGGK